EIVPTCPALIDAENVKREEDVFAVVSAAFATGSRARVSPPAQPAAAAAQRTRQSTERTRRGAIRPQDRRRRRVLLSLERGELGAPLFGVLAGRRRPHRPGGFTEPLRPLGEGEDGPRPHVFAVAEREPLLERAPTGFRRQ